MTKLKDHVIDERGYVLIGDSRGITVPYSLRQEVYKWAGKYKIIVEYQGSLAGMDLWYIKDEKHRNWFTLRWS